MGPDVMPILLDEFKNGDLTARRDAADVFCYMQSDAIVAIPLLVERLLNPENDYETGICQRTLAAIGPKARPALKAAYDEGDEQIKKRIDKTLEMIKDQLGRTLIRELCTEEYKQACYQKRYQTTDLYYLK
jgi:hypothetical protein